MIASIESVHLVKCGMHIVDRVLKELLEADARLFDTLFEEEGGTFVQPVVPTILFIAPNHTDKAFLKLGKGIWIKGKDKDLTPWLVASVEGVNEPYPGLVADVAQRWYDRNDNMFPEQADSEQVTQFQSTQ